MLKSQYFFKNEKISQTYERLGLMSFGLQPTYLTLKQNENWEESDYLRFLKWVKWEKKLCLPDHKRKDHKIDEIFHFSGAMPLLMPYFCQHMNQSDFELFKNMKIIKNLDFFYEFVDIVQARVYGLLLLESAWLMPSNDQFVTSKKKNTASNMFLFQ